VYIADAINQQIRMLSPPRTTTVGAVFSAPVCDGQYFHHVAVTFDGSTVNVYVDGDVYATTPLLINTANGAPAALSIGGARQTPDIERFRGSVSDLRVYDSALSPADVLALSQPPLFAYANSVMLPPTPTWAAPQYSWMCLPGFKGATLSLSRSFTDSSWSSSGGPMQCSACAGLSYSFGGSNCATCAAGSSFVSASAGCQPGPTSPGPTNSVLYLSGAAGEGISAFITTQESGLGFVTDHVGESQSALSLIAGSSIVTTPLPQLPSGLSARSVSAWVRCSASPSGSTLVDLWDGTSSVATEHLTLVALPVSSAASMTTAPYVKSLIAGSPSSLAGYRDDVGSNALFSTPSGIAIDGNGVLYIGDRLNNVIRMITMPDATVTTLAGTATAGAVDGVGTAASFNYPQGLAVDPTGAFLAICDFNNNKIRKLVIATRAVSTLVTLGTGYTLPLQISFDLASNIYFSSYAGHRVQMLTPVGVMSTVAGNGSAMFADGPAGGAINAPRGVAFDNINNLLYIGDSGNKRVRSLNLATGRSE
jgi:hypothetical protein